MWTASKFVSGGYGQLMVYSVSKMPLRAHRVSWELFRGAIPDGLHVLHRCDNPACVNPEHLFLGTATDNMADKYRKGRQARGEGVARPKLTEAKVRENVQCAIMRVCADEAIAAYPAAAVTIAPSDTVEDMEANVDAAVEWAGAWSKREGG